MREPRCPTLVGGDHVTARGISRRVGAAFESESAKRIHETPRLLSRLLRDDGIPDDAYK